MLPDPDERVLQRAPPVTRISPDPVVRRVAMPVACAATSPDPVVETVSVSQRTRTASTSLVTALARAVQAVGRQPQLGTWPPPSTVLMAALGCCRAVAGPWMRPRRPVWTGFGWL
jgi:hypothetical protein